MVSLLIPILPKSVFDIFLLYNTIAFEVLRFRRVEPETAMESGMIAPSTRPRLPRGVRLVHNEAQGGWVLLAPERVFKADAIAHEILKRCTGEATLEQIVDDLAAAFNAPRERIHDDVVTLIGGLADKKLLVLS
jgi:pyrroloquinoline quinone biosynthesis protein D